jgi:general secretion pathway protein I
MSVLPQEKMEDGRPRTANSCLPLIHPQLSIVHPRFRRRGGFTLIEVIATMLLIAIVLPAVMKGVAAVSVTANTTRHRSEASGLAEAKLNELVVSNEWQNGVLSGDFGTDWPEYKWQATVQAWPLDSTNASIQEIDLRVSWMWHGTEDFVTASTLTYARSTTAAGTSGP